MLGLKRVEKGIVLHYLSHTTGYSWILGFIVYLMGWEFG